MIFALFLTAALLNLMVGVVMALTWEWFSQPGRQRKPRPPKQKRPKKEKPKKEQPPVETPVAEPAAEPIGMAEVPQPEEIESEASEEEPPAPEEPLEPTPIEECVPLEWLDILAQHAVEARSFVEATAQVLRLKILAYRESLILIENQIRRLPEDVDNAELDGLIVKLIGLNGDWLHAQSDAMGALIDRKDTHQALDPIASQLEDVLLEQNALIETSRLELESMQEDQTTDATTLVVEIGRMIDCAHRLRDLMQQSLAAILAVEGRHDECEEAWQLDTLCHMVNRTGMEIQIHGWRISEHALNRENSLLLFDIDQFRSLNMRYGTRLADQLLAELSKLLNNSLRQDRGFDRLGRYSGQQFVALLGGTSVEQAGAAAERLRRIVEQTVFRCADVEIPLRVTCAVVGLPAREPVSDVLARLEAGLAEAKLAAQDRTPKDSDVEADYQQSPEFKGEPKQIEIDEKYAMPELAVEPVEA